MATTSVRQQEGRISRGLVLQLLLLRRRRGQHQGVEKIPVDGAAGSSRFMISSSIISSLRLVLLDHHGDEVVSTGGFGTRRRALHQLRDTTDDEEMLPLLIGLRRQVVVIRVQQPVPLPEK